MANVTLSSSGCSLLLLSLSSASYFTPPPPPIGSLSLSVSLSLSLSLSLYHPLVLTDLYITNSPFHIISFSAISISTNYFTSLLNSYCGWHVDYGPEPFYSLNVKALPAVSKPFWFGVLLLAKPYVIVANELLVERLFTRFVIDQRPVRSFSSVSCGTVGQYGSDHNDTWKLNFVFYLFSDRLADKICQ